MNREKMIEKLDIFCKNHKLCDDYPACPLYPCELDDFCELQDSELKKAYNDVFARKITIPADATNVDVIKALFPNSTWDYEDECLYISNGVYVEDLTEVWWNATYMAGGEE